MDIVTKKKRSEMMSGIGGKNTKPELIIRSILHRAGYRYGLHRKDLPGKPDIVLNKHKTVVIVNGCFWHMHDCHLFKLPSTRTSFWKDKLSKNKIRDENNQQKLNQLGWKVIVVWECVVKGKHKLSEKDLLNSLKSAFKSDNGLNNIG